MACDLLLAAFSKQIHRKTRVHTRDCPQVFNSKTRIHTQGLSPSLSQVNPLQITRTYPGTVPGFSPRFQSHIQGQSPSFISGTVPEFLLE
jgi:hypothetical protein